MFYLYLKKHNTTNLNYVGYTGQDPYTYKGSGTHWKRHIKKHGYDVTTIVLYETPFIEDIEELGLYYSDLWNIVESTDYANLKQEAGGGGYLSDETKAKIGAVHKGKTLSDETKAKIGAANKGKTPSDETKTKTKMRSAKLKMSDETKAKMSASHKGRTHSDEHKAKIGAASKGKTLSDEHKAKIGVANKGRNHSDETKAKISAALKGESTCPHCGKTDGTNVMNRHHFNNCKLKPTI